MQMLIERDKGYIGGTLSSRQVLESEMKKMILATMLAVGLGSAGGALAHGAKPKHGGVVATANDLHFELVNKSGTPVVYVEDHGKALATTGMTGKMTVLNGTKKTELPLQPAGDNILQATGEAKLAKGTKAVALIALPDSEVVSVRFSVK
jgi:hypothetical protein